MTEPDLSRLRAEAELATHSYRELRRNFAVLQQELAQVRGQATSFDEYVTVETGPQGELVELRLDGRIYRNPDAAALSRTIIQTVAAAAQDGAEKVQTLSDRYAAGAAVTGRATAANMTSRLENLESIQERLMEGWPQ